MDFVNSGKIALITGAGSGIGRGTAEAFAKSGAIAIIADVNAEGGRETVSRIEKMGGKADFIKVDVTKENEVGEMIDHIVSTYGRLDFAHNNAGIVENPGPFTEMTEAMWDREIDINLKGIFLCMKHEIIYMEKQGSGAIVNTAAPAGFNGIEWIPIYAASKHGLIGLTKSVAIEYANKGIRINAVSPHRIASPVLETIASGTSDPRNPMGRFGKVEEVAAAVLWLCSDQASFTTGTVLTVDGGFSAKLSSLRK